VVKGSVITFGSSGDHLVSMGDGVSPVTVLMKLIQGMQTNSSLFVRLLAVPGI
jgi:hypothetical protein